MSPIIKVVEPSGILDSPNASKFRQEISHVVDSGVDIVLIDLKDVTFMDSSGLGALVLALKTVRAAGGKLYICSINEQVKMLFDLTSMDRVFDIYTDRSEFNDVMLSLSESGRDAAWNAELKKLN